MKTMLKAAISIIFQHFFGPSQSNVKNLETNIAACYILLIKLYTASAMTASVAYLAEKKCKMSQQSTTRLQNWHIHSPPNDLFPHLVLLQYVQQTNQKYISSFFSIPLLSYAVWNIDDKF